MSYENSLFKIHLFGTCSNSFEASVARTALENSGHVKGLFPNAYLHHPFFLNFLIQAQRTGGVTSYRENG